MKVSVMGGRLWVFRAFGVPEGKPFLDPRQRFFYLWINSNSENILHAEIELQIPKEKMFGGYPKMLKVFLPVQGI